MRPLSNPAEFQILGPNQIFQLPPPSAIAPPMNLNAPIPFPNPVPMNINASPFIPNNNVGQMFFGRND